MQKALPLGSTDFRTLRSNNEIYVDKTDMIYRLAQTRGKVFLARPRRFGKSLLVSTFESLFKRGISDFQGLSIEKLWKDKTYPVIRLDFSLINEFNTIEKFREAFQKFIYASFKPIGFSFDDPQSDVVIDLSSWMQTLAPSSLVLLIDEYDAPLTNCLDQPRLFKEVRAIMGRFFLALKSNEGCLRFFFMTGITKFCNASIFTAFNNLQDISLNPFFGTLLGFTEEEIKEYFGEYLTRASVSIGISESKLLADLRNNYDGFCFDSQAKIHVYCPWSVLNFFDYPEVGFEDYWYSSGGHPTVLMKHLHAHTLKSPTVYDEDILLPLSDLNTTRQYDEISTEALLTQSGYLTIKARAGGDFVRLGYPNQEVARSMARLYAKELLRGENIARSGVPRLADVMATESPAVVVDYFNRALTAIDYARYPVKNEAACRAYLQVLLIGAALVPKVEVHNALGRSDMEVEAGNRHWIFEFKYAEKAEQVDTCLKQAVEQIQSRRYGEDTSGKERIRIALVFCTQEKRLSAWQTVE